MTQIQKLPQNLRRINPTLKDVMSLLKKDILLNLFCHAVGTVQSFDASKQTVTATVNYLKTSTRLNSHGVYEQVNTKYPVLLDVPVVVYQGGGAALTMPIASGDTCLIHFNDRDIDNWFHSGQVAPTASQRLHSFSDAIAMVGIRSQNNALSDYDSARAVLRNEGVKVAVGTAKVEVSNDSQSLADLLQDLLQEVKDLTTQIQLLTVVCAAPGNPSSPPVNVAAFVAIGVRLSATATELGDLLE